MCLPVLTLGNSHFQNPAFPGYLTSFSQLSSGLRRTNRTTNMKKLSNYHYNNYCLRREVGSQIGKDSESRNPGPICL